MKQSTLFSRTLREAPKDEEAVNAKLLARAGFVEKLMAGVYSYLPLGYRVLKNVENIVREEMDALGAQEILMPALQPKANWAQTGRWETYDSLFRFTSHYSKNDYVFGPTHEEIVSPLAQRVVFSYKDLPQAVFQIQAKFRDEKRAKSGLLRGREFLMKDLYSFHADEKDLDEYYEKTKQAYVNVFRRVGIGDSTFLTFASGGTFSKYSHEFQTLTEAGEDIIYLCRSCGVAVNEEIIADQSTCPSCGTDKLEKEKGAEVGNIFKLMTKYSVPFGLQYKDEKGKQHDVIMGCYGIGVSRLVGVVVEKSHDERGIIWPEAIAPFKAHVVELNGADASQLYEDLQSRKISVLYDERNAPAGQKLTDADLIGLPYRLVVSPHTGDKIEVKRRAEQEGHLMAPDEVFALLAGN